MEKQGVFYAVSVGPGDPELLTRQACRVLEACDIIAAPRMKSGRMLALDIAAGAVDMQGKTILPLDFTMARDAAVREDSYRTAAAAVEAALAAMTETLLAAYGDLPLLYAGGVMSNSLLREHLTARFGGSFAPPAFSADNAAGIAVLCRLREEGEL